MNAVGRRRSCAVAAVAAVAATTACSSLLTPAPKVASNPAVPGCTTSVAVPTLDAVLAASTAVASYATWPIDDVSGCGNSNCSPGAGLGIVIIGVVALVWIAPPLAFAGWSAQGFRTVGTCRRARRDHAAAHAAWRADQRQREDEEAAIASARTEHCGPALALVERRRGEVDPPSPFRFISDPAIVRCLAADAARRHRETATATRVESLAGGITPAIRTALAGCRAQPPVSGPVHLQLSIDPTGALLAVVADAGGDALVACATAALAPARFPASPHGIQLIYDLPAPEPPP